MTFKDALEKIKDAQSLGYTYHLGNVVQAIAEQVEANRLAIEQLKQQPAPKPWTPPKLELRGNLVAIVRDINGKPLRERQPCIGCGGRGGWEDGDEGQWVTCLECKK